MYNLNLQELREQNDICRFLLLSLNYVDTYIIKGRTWYILDLYKCNASQHLIVYRSDTSIKWQYHSLMISKRSGIFRIFNLLIIN